MKGITIAQASRLVQLFTLSILIFACSNQSMVYDKYKSIDDMAWHADSIVVFEAKVLQEFAETDWNIHVRNKGNYPFQNLWLFISVETPKGETWTDTVEVKLADESGRWFGSGIGDLYDATFPFKTNVAIQDTGVYKISMRQGMRSEHGLLNGISDIGFQIADQNIE